MDLLFQPGRISDADNVLATTAWSSSKLATLTVSPVISGTATCGTSPACQT